MKITNPPIKVTTQVLTFLYENTKRNRGCTEKEIIDYIGKTESYVMKAIAFLDSCSIIIRKKNKIFLEKVKLRLMDGTENSAKKLIKDYLVNNKYFVEYSSLISKGRNPKDAVKLVKTIYNIEQKEDTILKIFNEWVKFLRIDLKEKPTRNKSLENLENANNALLTNKFLKEEFGDCYRYISSHVLKDLSEAIQNIKSKREDALNDAGRALEDFLRIDLASDINLTRCNGIVQISNELNKFPDKFPTKLNNIASSLGNIRSMGKAHGVDARLNRRWIITENAAVSYVLMIICLMKAYIEYKINNNTLF